MSPVQYEGETPRCGVVKVHYERRATLEYACVLPAGHSGYHEARPHGWPNAPILGWPNENAPVEKAS